jgi:hypothetical protein
MPRYCRVISCKSHFLILERIPLIITSTLSWSIGGPAGLNILGPILGGGKGLSGSHNKYAVPLSSVVIMLTLDKDMRPMQA